MSDEECPHGLEADWCSLCKAAAAPRTPVAPARDGRRPGAGPTRSTRPSTSRARTTPRTPAPPLTPTRALARLRPVLFHVTALGAWESIGATGLRTAAKLVADAGRPPPVGLRGTAVEVTTDVGPAVLRDQRLQVRSRIEAHLDGIDLAEWLAIMDERVHLYARQKDVTGMLTRYQAEGQDLVVFDTARLLAAGGDRVEVATVASAAPEAWGTCRCRGRDTFVPLGRFDDPVPDIEEVTVVGGIDEVEAMVTRVVRHHPDRTTEVVFERP